MSPPDVTKIPSLASQLNNREWLLEVRAVAMLGAFDGIETAPSTADAAQIERVADRDMKAQGVLLSLKSVSRLLREELMKYKPIATAATTTIPAVTRDPEVKDVWDCPETKLQKDGVSAPLDFQLFLSATPTDDGTVEAQLNKSTDLHTRAETRDFIVEGWQFASIMSVLASSSKRKSVVLPIPPLTPSRFR